MPAPAPQSGRLSGLTVASLESRMTKLMGKLLEREGASPLLAPSMQEIPLNNNTAVFHFFDKLEAGEFDLLVLMTGVGVRTMVQILETKYDKMRIIKALNDKVKVLVRGPKPVAACKALEIHVDFTIPEPNTWHEILHLLDDEMPLAGKRVAVQEYGIANPDFYDGLTARGADYTPLQVYKWSLPDDVGPLLHCIDEIIAGRVDLLLFTSAHQAVNLLQLARERGREADLRRALTRVGIASIGPTTSAQLGHLQLFPDLEASPNKMDDLIALVASDGPALAAAKKQRAEEAWIRVGEVVPNAATLLHESLVMRACRREANERIPVWLMRQAGRYMAEYQMVRSGRSFLELCKDAELAAEVTLTAVERLGVDAAIIFADILLIVEPMGVGLDFTKGAGPTIQSPLRTVDDITQLKAVDIGESLTFVMDAIGKVRKAMHPRIPLIGFAGAPFTVASYMIEGKGSRNYIPTKTLMHCEPQAWHQLMEKLTRALADYVNAQIAAGCQLVQLFDSWVGCLSPHDYREFVLPHNRRLIASITKGVPVIHFGTGTATLLELQKEAGGDVIGLDWRVEIGPTWERLGNVAVQGNLDPAILFSTPEIIRAEAKKILDAVGKKPGFIFNLGHGILPETPVDHVMDLIDFIHEYQIS